MRKAITVEGHLAEYNLEDVSKLSVSATRVVALSFSTTLFDDEDQEKLHAVIGRFRRRERLAITLRPAGECSHEGALSTPGLGCIDAASGDERISRRWCPACGALEVVVESTQERTWISPQWSSK